MTTSRENAQRSAGPVHERTGLDWGNLTGALRYTHYGWLTRMLMRRIVAKAGGDTDTSRDYDYTDWTDLAQFGRTFAEGVMRRAATTAAHREVA